MGDMVTPVPTKIIWSYGEWQPAYQSLSDKVHFVQGLPDLPQYSQEPLLLVIDDQMHGVDRVTSSFTKGSHDLFDQHKDHLTISLNTHYLVIFKNPRDGSQIVNLTKQMYPGKTHYVRQAFVLATQQPHNYLVIDLKQVTLEGMWLRSHIFPGKTQEVYVEDI